MKKTYTLIGVLSVFAALGPAAGHSSADDKQAGENKLAALEPFLGEWEIHARWTDGNELHARNVIDWGIAKKFITAKTFVRDGATEYQRYDAVMGWHPKKNSLFQISFTYNGEINETIIEPAEKDALHIGWKPFTVGQPSPVRQIIKFTDKDSYVWTVLLKDGDNWKKLIEGTWTRKK
jgi:hypothetical protein